MQNQVVKVVHGGNDGKALEELIEEMRGNLYTLRHLVVDRYIHRQTDKPKTWAGVGKEKLLETHDTMVAQYLCVFDREPVEIEGSVSTI